MKPEDYSKAKNNSRESTDNKNQISRREVLNKAGWYALSAATMMVLMKSQAKASTSVPAAPTPTPAGTEWRRTTRT